METTNEQPRDSQQPDGPAVKPGRETIKAKLRKIAALAQRGVGGEKANAQRLLQTLLAKHNLKLEDVVPRPENESKRYWFTCTTQMEKDVLFACYCRAKNVNEIRYYQAKRKIGFDLSLLEALELQSLWQHFRPLLRKEFRKERARFGQAFAWKHSLCSNQAPSEDREPLSEAEYQALVRLMQGMEDSDYVSTRRQLGSA